MIEQFDAYPDGKTSIDLATVYCVTKSKTPGVVVVDCAERAGGSAQHYVRYDYDKFVWRWRAKDSALSRNRA